MVPVFVPLILGTVQAVRVDRSGIVADVVLLPDGDGPYPARMALPGAGVEHGGPYIPLEKDDTVLLACPNGDPGDGFLLLARFFEQAEPVPPAIVDAPTDEHWVAKPGRVLALQTTNGDLVMALAATASGARGVLRLGSRTASQAAVLGDQQKALEKPMLDALFTALTNIAAAFTAAGAPFAAQAASVTAAATAVQTFSNSYDDILSERVKLE